MTTPTTYKLRQPQADVLEGRPQPLALSVVSVAQLSQGVLQGRPDPAVAPAWRMR
ncbi:MAG: hypothetical protein ACK59A_01310 [Cyanobacteriota bacterium]